MKETEDFLSKPYRLLVGADHGGWELKNRLVHYLRDMGIDVDDVGPDTLDAGDDYPDFANALARRITRGDGDGGILLCRTGIGMCINANRYPYIRAALAGSEKAAEMSRLHNNANVLVTGGDDMSDEILFAIVDKWLATPFTGDERHCRRLRKIETDSYDDILAVRRGDPEVAEFLDAEYRRQDEILELIASENIVSPAVRAAQGSCLTNKYAEGYPGRRYYDGCEHVDDVERLAIQRAKAVFGAEAVNVQPHSGSQANMAVYFALLEPGDTVLAMDLAHGGHLTHGHKVNFSGRFYNFIGYGVNRDTELIDYDQVEQLALEHRPKLILAGASAYPRIIDFERLRAIADQVDARLMVDMAHIAGLVAAGVHPSPVPHADVVTTTTHKTLRGPRAGMILCREAYIKAINSQIFPGIQGGPLMHVIAAKAVCLGEALTPEFKAYQEQTAANARRLAGKLSQHGFRIVSGGTDNHLMLVDLRPLNTTGKIAAKALDEAGITVNKNLIPFDPEKPFVTSGLRIGTPSVTTRGMAEGEMEQIADWIYDVVSRIDDTDCRRNVREAVRKLTSRFPMPTIS